MASSSSNDWVYDVYPSFSGEDVRGTFLAHFLKELDRKLIIAFNDNEIERSQSLDPVLKQVIRNSRIAVVILSEKYASSTWCLDELLEIFKCKDEFGQLVIPVFYGLDPSHVRKQTGKFGKIFAKTCLRKTEDETSLWRQSLTKVASLLGYHSQSWPNEAKMIEAIANDVSDKLNVSPPKDFEDFVGMDDHIAKMSDLLDLESQEVRMAGIWGTSGIGKTSIARALFSQLSRHFQGSVFIDSAFVSKSMKIYKSANSDDYNMKLHLLNSFLSELLDQKDIRISSLGGVEEKLKNRKVLIVIDGLEDQVVLDTLVGQTQWFGSGSRIIVITKDKQFLRAHGIDNIYEVGLPSKELALQIFCKFCFRKNFPPDGFMELASEVVSYTGNLPFGLKVLGSHLKGRNKEDFEYMLLGLKNGLDGEIEKTLRVSYDGLNDKKDQAIFRHIACLFNGETVKEIKMLLADSGLDVNIGLKNLVDKSLIHVRDDVVEMHYLLQKLGKEIVRAQSIDPGEREFIMDSKDICHVLESNTGTNKVLGITLDMDEIYELRIHKNAFEGMRNLLFIKIYSKQSYHNKGVIWNLREGFDYLPHKLRLLRVDRYPLRNLPSNFCPENLVKLQMQRSNLERLWEGVHALEGLKEIDLRKSIHLKEIPDLSMATNLVKLDLSDCLSLVELPSSIRRLNKLEILIIRGCSSLQTLPKGINLQSLYRLDLLGCHRLNSFSNISTNIPLTYDKSLSEHPEVFINFRGADLRHGFIDNIAKALKSYGLKVYIDADELPREDHTKLLYQRIEESRIALVIFSNRYTESRWFLNKLVKIKELLDEQKLLVIPIFYQVDELEVTQLKGDFGFKFWNLWRITRDIHVIRWKEALESCGSLKGICLKEHEQFSESELITLTVDEVIERVSLLKRENPSLCLSTKKGESTDLATLKGEKHETYLNKCQLFGMEQRMEQLERKLEFDSKETRIVGVVGMPGIGKTALAMMFHEKWSCKFIRSVPLLSIRKKSEEYGLEWLQKTFWEVLLERTLPEKSDMRTHKFVKDKLLQKKIFVVLDDVSNKKQLDFLLGDLDWIKKGSKIVITTSDKSLLEGFSHDTYVVPQLNYKESSQHFTYHAFDNHKSSPTKTFVELGRKFVEYSRGHPLALKILGRELRGRTKAQWEEKLEMMMVRSNMLTEYIWRVSINQLNDRQKDVFLDIVYFFNSEDEYFVKSLLDSGDPDSSDAVSEVRDLTNKFLITISDSRVEINPLWYMCAKDLSSHERYKLWNFKNFGNMLLKTEKQEANNVRGIFFDMSEITKSIALDCMAFTDMLNLRYLKIYDSCCPRQCKATWNLYLPDGLEFPLAEVRYLHWVKFPLQELPSDIIPKNLVDLRLPYSRIKHVWKGVKDTPRLKWVDLSHSSELLDLSALSKAENLQRLNLEGCTSLDQLPVEIQNMDSLVFLNMKGCTSLCHLPEMNLVSLKTVILSGCSNLKEFKIISESIEFLHLDGTAIKELTPAIQNLQKLVTLNLKNCKMLECLPNCLGKLKVLDELILSGCSRLKDLPYVRNSLKHLKSLLIDGTGAKEMPSVSCFTGSEGRESADMSLQSIGLHSTVRKWPCSVDGVSSLQRLCLSGNDFISLQPDIGKLYNLIWLDVKNCKKLRCVPMLPPRLRYFDAHGCDSLEKVANSLAIPMLSEQINATFNFSNCYNLDQDAKESIVSYTRLKSQLVLDEMARCGGGLVLEVLSGSCFPGWEVPVWFIHQAFGSVLKPKILSHWCDINVTGIALCAVVEFSEYHCQRNRCIVECSCEFKNEDGSIIRHHFTVGGWGEPCNTPQKIESSHVFIGFTSRLHINKIAGKDDEEKCFCTETSMKFQITDGKEEIKGCKVVKCGFTLVYEYGERGNICLDSNTFVIPERIENIPSEGRPYGNSRRISEVPNESYSGLTLRRDETFLKESKSDVTQNLQQSFDSKRFNLLHEENDARGAIVVSSYHDNTFSGSLVKHKMHSLVGVELRLKQMEKMLYSTPGNTRIVGVVGMPGIGKTTLATILFEKRGCKFPSHLFLTMSTACSLEQLRTVFLAELLKHENQDINDNTTHESVKDKLLQSKVFVVLNGVSDKKQLEFLLGNLNWIKKGSKIVITTCDKSLLEGLAQDTYVVQQLNNQEAFQLFTYHAFYNQMCPSETFISLSRMFVDHAAGNPQTLKYLGSLLCGKDKTYWEQELHKVRQSFDMKMRDVWRFSIDQLNEQQKDVFLDILYFFKSEDEYFVRNLLDSENPEAMSEVRDLAGKFLVTISGGPGQMHDQLHTLGKDLGSPGRHVLQNYEEIIKLKQQDANKVRGVFLDMSEITKSIALDCMAFTDMLNLRYLKIYDSCCPRQCKATCNLYLPDGLEFPLAEVRYLHWVKFPLQELPADIIPKNLVDLRLPYSRIKHIWKCVKDTPRLKWVDLSHSSELLDLSALSKAENLQRLNLEGCTSLDELPVEIQNMRSLVFLNMRGCTSLCHLPEMNLFSLRTLILSDCSNLMEFEIISESVEFLHLDGTAIKELPPAIQNLQKLVTLNLKNCKMLEFLPNCLGKLKVLDELILSGCSRLKDLPYVQNSFKHLKSLLIDGTGAKEMPSVSCFTGSEGRESADTSLQSIGLHSTVRKWPCSVDGVSSLQRLCLSGNDFISLQPDIGNLYNLIWLDVKNCKKLRCVPMLPPRLRYFDAHGCDSLEKVANSLAIPMLSEQINATFNFSNCYNLDQDAKDSIISYTRLKSQSVLDELTRYNGGLGLEVLTGSCFPGWEVPVWFSHQAFGSVLKPKMLSHWSEINVTGIALCAVVEFSEYHCQRNRCIVECSCEFKNEDGSIIHYRFTVGECGELSNTPRKIESSHVFIGFTSRLRINKISEKEDEEKCFSAETSIKFQVTDGMEEIKGCKVVKCGFTLTCSGSSETSKRLRATLPPCEKHLMQLEEILDLNSRVTKTNADVLDRASTNSLTDNKITPPQIQVFINFRGMLRNNFVGYLVHALQKREVNVYIDNNEKRGEDLNTLFKRIEDSRIAIVVFSTRYTESTWCLEELVKIKERVEQGLLKVLPIFYKVDPTNVKKLKGEFGDHFRDREERFGYDSPKIKRWKEAIKFATEKHGLTFDDKSDALEIDFVESIVKEVLVMLQSISIVESGQFSRYICGVE